MSQVNTRCLPSEGYIVLRRYSQAKRVECFCFLPTFFILPHKIHCKQSPLEFKQTPSVFIKHRKQVELVFLVKLDQS